MVFLLQLLPVQVNLEDILHLSHRIVLEGFQVRGLQQEKLFSEGVIREGIQTLCLHYCLGCRIGNGDLRLAVFGETLGNVA